MQVQQIMTKSPACCAPDTPLREAARMMAENDCGAIPVLDGQFRLIGVITDRDIACRGVAQGSGPDAFVQSVMSNPVVTATLEASLEDCCNALAMNRIRRIPIVDENGTCCGILSQADIALCGPEKEIADLVSTVSKPSAEPSLS